MKRIEMTIGNNMKNRRFTTILWDVDNTLLDFEYSMTKAMHACFQAFGEELTQEMLARYEQINDSWWKRLERGEVTKKQLLNGRFLDFFGEYRISHMDVDEFRTMFQTELGRHYSYMENSLEICGRLQGSVKQYIVTNGVLATQTSKIRASGFWEFMDGIFISEVIGYEKPRIEFFDQCLSRIDEKDKNKILIVGDSLSSDIKGGNNAGIKTCWYNPSGKKAGENYHIDYEMNSLQQIFEIIYG